MDLSLHQKSGEGVIDDLLCFLGHESLQPGRVQWAPSPPAIPTPSTQNTHTRTHPLPEREVQMPLALSPSVLLAPYLEQAFWTAQSFVASFQV